MLTKKSFVIFISILFLLNGAFAYSVDELAALEPYQSPPAPDASQWSDAQLLSFANELTNFVYDNMVVTDSTRATFGKTYEFFDDGRQYEIFALDSMHDGAWFANSMFTAHRIWPEGNFLSRVMTYQLPFYLNAINNSDVLFPNKVERQDNKPIEEPLKGWVPRGWNDGEGWCFSTHTQFNEMQAANVDTYETIAGEFLFAYGTPSNHLAQDLCDMLLDSWVASKDPAMEEAAMHIRNFRNEYFGEIAPIEFAAGVLNDRPDIWERFRPGGLNLETVPNHPYYSGAYMLNTHQLRSDNDGLAFDYQKAITEYYLLGELPVGYVLRGLSIGHGSAATMEMFYDDRDYPYGMYKFDLQVQPHFLNNGKLSDYYSTSDTRFGGRGIQLSWITTALLPALVENPGIWEKYYNDHFAGEPLVRIVENGPVTDGTKDLVYNKGQALHAGDTTVTMVSDPKHLHIFIESNQSQVDIELRHTGPTTVTPPTGYISAYADGLVVAANNMGEDILFASASAGGENWVTEIRIPYTYVKAQNPWINGVENGRYNVRINGGDVQVVYMLSEPERIISRLEDIALGTIQTWYDVWNEKGVIPSGWYRPEAVQGKWTVADVGNFAHLIKTIAYWQMYQSGTSEWELLIQQLPAEPVSAEPLPETTIDAQMLIKLADDTVAPTVPEDIAVDFYNHSQVYLSWSPSTDNIEVAGYRIYRDGIMIAETADTSYIDGCLDPLAQYSYRVKAYDTSDNESDLSSSVSVTTRSFGDISSDGLVYMEDLKLMAELWLEQGDCFSADLSGDGQVNFTDYSILINNWTGQDSTPPTDPSNLTVVEESDTFVTLSWDGSFDESGTVFYNIYRDDVHVHSTLETSYTDTELSRETTYIYYVIATDPAGNESGPSETVTATTLAAINMLSNPSFENGSDKWSIWQQGAGHLEIVSADTIAGVDAIDGDMIIVMDGTEIFQWGPDIQQNSGNFIQPTQANKTYRFSAWLKMDNITPADNQGVRLAIFEFNAEGGLIGLSGTAWSEGQGSSDWKLLEIERTMTSEHSHSAVRIDAGEIRDGFAYWDMAELIEID